MTRLTNSHHGSSVAHSVSAEHRHTGERQAAIGRGMQIHAQTGSVVTTLPMDRPSSGRALASEPSHQASSPLRWTSRTVAHGHGAVKGRPPSRAKTSFTTRRLRSGRLLIKGVRCVIVERPAPGTSTRRAYPPPADASLALPVVVGRPPHRLSMSRLGGE